MAAIDNVAAFQEVKFKPRVADIPARDLTVTIMGVPSSMPIMIAPAGGQAVHPEGEVAAAQASKTAGIPLRCPTMDPVPSRMSLVRTITRSFSSPGPELETTCSLERSELGQRGQKGSSYPSTTSTTIGQTGVKFSSRTGWGSPRS